MKHNIEKTKYVKKCLVLLVFFIALTKISAQDIFGKWKTVDDHTGKAKSIVHIYEENGKATGRIIDIINDEAKQNLCEGCDGDKKDKPIMGMIIFEGLVNDNNVYKGTILDPGRGKEYTCKIWLEENNPDILNVRGYIAFLYRTQQWIRIEE